MGMEADCQKLMDLVRDGMRRFCYYPDIPVTRQRMKAELTRLVENSVDGSDVSVGIDDPPEYDELAISSNTYAEYRLRHAIMFGDECGIDECEYAKRHCYCPGQVTAVLTVRPRLEPHEVRVFNVKMGI